MNKIEQVARAIYETWARSRGIDVGWDEVQGMSETEGFPSGKAVHQLAMDEARAAIEAMREPTEAMKVAGCKQDDPLGELIDWRGDRATTREVVSGVYQAMIDDLLSED